MMCTAPTQEPLARFQRGEAELHDEADAVRYMGSAWRTSAAAAAATAASAGMPGRVPDIVYMLLPVGVAADLSR